MNLTNKLAPVLYHENIFLPISKLASKIWFKMFAVLSLSLIGENGDIRKRQIGDR